MNLRIALLVLLLLASGFNLDRQYDSLKASRMGDYVVYYQAGEKVREGTPDLLYEGRTPAPEGKEFVVHEFQNLPVFALVFVPLSGLPLQESARLWLVIISACTILSFLSLCVVSGEGGGKGHRIQRSFLVLLVMINFEPLFRSLSLGQTTPVCLLLLPWMYYLAKDRRDMGAGILLALLFLVKIPFLLVALYFLAAKRYRLVASFGVCMAILVVLSLLLFGIDLHLQYFSNNVLRFLGKGLGAFNNQSASAFLIRTFTSAPLASWIPVRTGAWIDAVSLVLGASLLAAAFVTVRGRRPPEESGALFEEKLALVLSLMLLVFPVSWIHYYSFLIPAYVLLLPRFREGLQKRERGLPIAFAASYSLIALFPVRPNSYYRNIEGSFWEKLWCSHFFFGALVFFAACLLLIRRRRWCRKAWP